MAGKSTRVVGILAVLLLAALPVQAEGPAEIVWADLSDVELAPTPEGLEVQFGDGVLELEGKTVQLTGFMVPLEQSDMQAHFMISQRPIIGCFHCLWGGPKTSVEVKIEKAIEYTYGRVTVTGKLELVRTDPMLFYRVTGGSAKR